MVPEKTDEELYEEALRATCSLCIMEGRCVCGELDPIEEEEWAEDEENNGECDGGHCEDEHGMCIFCDKKLY